MNRSDTPGEVLLAVSGLTLTYGSLRAVDDVSFTVREGEVVSLIGPNGSGKSSTINLISGLLRPDGGRIEFEGAPIHGLDAPRVARAGIARTYQNGRVFGNLTVADNVEVGLHTARRADRPLRGRRWAHTPVLQWLPLLLETVLGLAGGRRQRAERLQVREQVAEQLARFPDRLPSRADDPAYTLSYANRRRTEIARALAAQPKLLLLDEPTAGMNPAETDEITRTLLELKAQGQTILLVEHKMGLVNTVSDRVIVLDGGRLLTSGSPEEVRDDPRVVGAYLGRGASGRLRAAERTKADDATEPVLALEHVDVRYGAFQALRSVSLEVGAGEIVCLLGGNASGKSTTMKTLLGLVRPAGGAVRIDGEDVSALPTPGRIRRGVASVPEARRIFPEMTVEENLLLGAFTRPARGSRRTRREIRADLDRVYGLFPRLGERRRQQGGSLSGGEQQMLAFGRALMSDPRVICMDEPTMGLSPRLVDEVLDTIVNLNRELGIATLLVEQNAEAALSIADRGYLLAGGEVVLSGPAGELAGHPVIRDSYLGAPVSRSGA